MNIEYFINNNAVTNNYYFFCKKIFLLQYVYIGVYAVL